LVSHFSAVVGAEAAFQRETDIAAAAFECFIPWLLSCLSTGIA
jgi:hypothetical protein